MLIVGTLLNESYLEEINDSIGFVRLKWNFKLKLPRDGDYVDGMKIKEIIAEKEQERASDKYLSSIGNIFVSKPLLEQAAIRLRISSELDLTNFDLKVMTMQTTTELYKLPYHLWKNTLLTVHKEMTEKADTHSEWFNTQLEMKTEPTPYSSNQLFSICLYPAFGIPLPRDVAEKADSLLKFYELVKPLLFSMKYFKSTFCSSDQHPFYEHADIDRVPCVCLKFQPVILEWFLQRCTMNPRLNYNEQCKVYLVPKCSHKLSSIAKHEFRYSFSIIEKHLAINRRPMEKLLNSLARKVY
ncbi:unnamed protein product [Didymodactylos carnosus]|uniref:Uncharacterized protein n=1 Tax=Didymodactylos carnosus TaxID=1234261 RepID=A0A815GLJ0_9BILA|nr:unnamed protein product [Didymodactylos carnosus]CAF1341542.1 unnamed protein product [Didymodactylos carnosus]CAF3795786.1 unnamed protein product [Didymodactylos carnosus]CAF4203091.1 unnamed protein product [Didymodactylos carnosus]